MLEENWTELGPKLKGKLHIWVGEADDFFLNNAVHKLDAFLSHAQPPYRGLDHLRARTGPLLDGNLADRDDEANGPTIGRAQAGHTPMHD